MCGCLHGSIGVAVRCVAGCRGGESGYLPAKRGVRAPVRAARQNNSTRGSEAFRSATGAARAAGQRRARRNILGAGLPWRRARDPQVSQVSPVVPVAGSTVSPDDPRPEPPERPADNECCGSGCDPCIFDYYYQEMDRYREALRAWEARQAARHAEDPAA
ncbi:conserved hypothetical protein [Cupriavidus taiwanensis]|uniref:Oxidoreductase-like domain-containing protein n=1 Tax=Cupriavidus taiwanensis TaxID=164546 RepID=A0A375J8R3_9BURK|nr:conserved hypothetical protein [Cupriavidus taiwanensis]